MKTVKLGSYMVAEEVTDDDWLIRNKNRGEILGTVAWYKPWRKHVFQPEEGTEYSSDCLQAIGMFLESLKRGKP